MAEDLLTVPGETRPSPTRSETGLPGDNQRQAFRRIRRLNLIMGTVHVVSGSLVIALSNSFSLPVTTSFLTTQPGGAPPADPTTQFELPIGPLVAAFLLLSAAAHLLLASPLLYPWYERRLRRGINPARWIEYSLSASLMIVVIAMLTGISDAVALLAIFAANAAMILFGWLMELHNQSTERTSWTAYWLGCLIGAVPWVGIGIYLFGPGDGVPGFVYAIFFSLFILFNCFALNMALQYRRIGPWRDYLFGERGYIWLSLVAKSALAWQVFANTLAL